MSGKDILSPTPRRLSCAEPRQRVPRVLPALRGRGLARKALRFHAYGCWTRRGIPGAELSNFSVLRPQLGGETPWPIFCETDCPVLAHSTWA